jgi:hypothetical protein
MDKDTFFTEAAKVAEIEELKKKEDKTESDKAVIGFFDKIYEAAETTEEK